MIILIAGYGHTGKTLLAQKLLEKLSYPYLSIDHLKMGLIRAGHTRLTPESVHEELADYLWPVVTEMIKTNIENGQNLIVEGCYIPFDYADSLSAEYLHDIRYVCLIFSEGYIDEHFDDIINYGQAIERRDRDSGLSVSGLKAAHQYNLEMCGRRGLEYILIDETYDINHFAEIVINNLK